MNSLNEDKNSKKIIIVKSGNKLKSINSYIIQICESMRKFNEIEVVGLGISN